MKKPQQVEKSATVLSKTLLRDLRGLIAQSREDVARQVNARLVMLYWRIGQRIRRDILKEKRAEYDERIVSALGTQLATEFGRGFAQGAGQEGG